MDYEQTLAYLYGLGRFGIKPGLERITAILHSLGNPQETLKVVHVAGTNGKGSSASFLSSIIGAGGYRVGLFTSPHLIDFSERISINGIPVSRGEVVSLAERVIASAPSDATFFELVTAMAYLHFHREKVDIAVMEVGMGGRFDATNAASGILSIITPVSLDHCEYLGSSLSAIAFEKGGVIKPGAPVVTARQEKEAFEVIAAKSSEVGSTLYYQDRDFSAAWEGDLLTYRGLGTELHRLRPGIYGRYQDCNAAVALCAAELLSQMGLPLDEAALSRGISLAQWPGRMEIVSENPMIMLDGAHNPAGSKALAESLAALSHRRLFLMAGVMGDKDLHGILSPLLDLAHLVICVAPRLDRALPSAELERFCRGYGRPAVDAGTVAEGLDYARGRAEAGDLILVCGSLFTVGEARGHLLSRPIRHIRA